MSEKRPRGRPRNEGADEKILDAARALLAEAGFAAFSVDAIAERTGIAKTTIYRRWATKGALVAAAMETPSQGTDAASILRETASLLALLAGADADTMDVLRAILAPRRERLRLALAPRADAALHADMLLGALVTEVIVEASLMPERVAEIIERA
jgi:AcrR family transcriptional regulator